MHQVTKSFMAGVALMTFGAAAATADEADVQARRIIQRLRVELAPIEEQIRTVPYLPALESGDVSLENLRAFAGEEYHIGRSDLRSAAQMVARYGGTPSGRFFKDVVDSETIVNGLLLDFARALGMTQAELEAYEPRPQAQTYPHFVTWLSVNGTDADMAAAFLVNFPVFGENVGRMGAALREQYGFTAEQTAYFDFLSFLPDSFETDALAVIANGLRRGDARRRDIRRSVRLLQAYELDFWRAVGED
jgi:pyrroloquinoline quinone (PQQ) biosynthesis protein C